MNALITGPHEVADAKALQHYIDDMQRWGNDIAYNTYYALPYSDVTGSLADAYRNFALKARTCGFPACIQIQATICRGDVVGISEAQYHHDNRLERWGDCGFFASFASTQWKDYLQNLTNLFIREYGYNWIVFQEPMYKVDIPGSLDRFHRLFLRTHPDEEYPGTREETSAYLKLQQLKAETLYNFFADLVKHAKSVGAESVGLMPWFFTPTIENTPAETLYTACDNGRLAAIPEVDFLVPRIRPDNVYANDLRTGDELQKSPLIHYSEVISHCVGKPVIALANPRSEQQWRPRYPRIPADYLRKSILATTATAANGTAAYWNGHNNDHNGQLQDVLPVANYVLTRIGHQRTPLAFVFSLSACRHAEPYTWPNIWPFYWNIAKQVLFHEKWPMLTLSADVLDEHLKMNPQLRMLIFEEHFALTAEQVETVVKWWHAVPGRVLLVIGSGLGFSADPNKPGIRPIKETFPGLLEHIGISQDIPPRIDLKPGAKITLTNRSREHYSLPQNGTVVDTTSIANIQRVFGSPTSVMFTDGHKHPVITKWNSGSTFGYFLGLGSSPASAPVITQLIRLALRTIKTTLPPVINADHNIFWNGSMDGYVVVANTCDAPVPATIHREPCLYWDIIKKQVIKSPKLCMDFPSNSIRAFRWVPKTAKLYDVEDAIHVQCISAGAGKAEVNLMAGCATAFIVRNIPREVIMDDETSEITVEECTDFYRIRLNNMCSGNHTVVFRW